MEVSLELETFFMERGINECVVQMEVFAKGLLFCTGAVLETLTEDDRDWVCACLGDMLEERTRLGASHTFVKATERSPRFSCLDGAFAFEKGYIYKYRP